MAGSLTQDGRPIVLTTPLGKDALLALEVTACEALSQTFTIEVEAFAPASQAADFAKLLGKDCSVALAPGAVDSQGARVQRHFHGICSRVEEGERNADFIRYSLTLVPKLWLLTRNSQSRIFQQMSVPDILKKVLTGIDAQWKIQGTFEPRDFCVQYRETDFEFASRLMEEEGIWYYFVHSAEKHSMVVANTPQGHGDLPGSAAVQFEEDLGAVREPDRIHEWSKAQELRSGKVVLWDHCFERPDQHLEAEKVVQADAAVGKATHKLKLGGVNDALVLYDYPGGYAQRFDGVDPGGGARAADLNKIDADKTRTAELRMQAETAGAVRITGSGNAVRMCAGHKFTLERHPGDADGKYVLTSVVHRASGGGNYASGGQDPFKYSNSFACIPEAVPFRPPRVTPAPFVRGSQTAVVVGPSGSEIFTDKYGRVKVQFHWDREGKNDASSACWLRVATTWAGKQWGAIHIPRIGQEVIVDFLEGDPDQPIIVGSVYNAAHMPPYELPANMTQSGIKSRSADKGTAENFNEIRFEDKKDKEEIYVHAEKDFKRIVENDDVLEVGLSKKDKGTQTITIHGDRTMTIKEGHETITIEKGNRTFTVKEGNVTSTIDKGSRTEKVKKDYVLTVEEGAHTVTLDKGNYDMKVSGGDHALTIDKGGSKVTISMGDQTTKLAAGKSSLEAMASIEFKCGPSSIKIEPAGITISGPQVKIEGTATVEAKSPMTTVKGDGMLTLKGGVTMIN